MKVLHINNSDTYGGAAIAGYRLHQGLLTQQVDSKLMVNIVQTKSDRVLPSPRNSWERRLSGVASQVGLNYLNLMSTFDWVDHPAYQAADVLNFHNLHGGYFNYRALPKLTRDKPAVITLHDMWSFTGHCSYSYGCDRWKTGCGNCPSLDIYPAVGMDRTDWEWKLKQSSFNHANVTVVAPSRWLVDQANQSLLRELPVHHIPYGVDLETYQPLVPAHCRELLGLPLHKYVVMFAAYSINDFRKGGDLLGKALIDLPPDLKAEIVLLTLGGCDESLAQTLGIETYHLGFVSNDRLKAIAYSAADLFVFPTRADNLPLVLQESMACGTPMVVSKVGGVPDLVRHGVTGYLAEAENAIDLRQGIVQLLEDPQSRQQMRHTCREIACAEYSLDLQASRYLELYRSLL